MKNLKYIFVFILHFALYSQNKMPTKAINGVYHLLEAERTIGSKTTKTKIFQYGLMSQKKIKDFILQIAN
ncbi:hypothetical protein [uncultured Polaribacter sp.]|uniref:hypothetical protein n=1 Tax=uncultured Polaribacter sp. TaxID=174711 RepID=UPI002633C9C3|nr:hypothetical protein [uncultured Polaribacter sp.]